MKAHDLVEQTGLAVKAGADRLDVEVTGGYAGDLLSAVMANAREGDLWVTWHVHPNIVAVALLVKVAAIVLVGGRQPEEETLRKAEEEHVPVLVSELAAFELIGRFHRMGISGER